MGMIISLLGLTEIYPRGIFITLTTCGGLIQDFSEWEGEREASICRSLKLLLTLEEEGNGSSPLVVRLWVSATTKQLSHNSKVESSSVQ